MKHLFQKGHPDYHKNPPWNKKNIDLTEVIRDYPHDRQAVRKFAEKYGVSTRTVRNRLQEIEFQFRHGSESSIGTQAREKNSNWKGGRRTSRGYVLVLLPDGRTVREHRLVVEQALGRKLSDEEKVHHFDGDKTNNNIENLSIISQSAHAKLHTTLDRLREMGRKGGKNRALAAKRALEKEEQ